MSVLEIISKEVAEISPMQTQTVSEDALLIQYGLDSVRSMDLVCALEEHFEIEVPDEDLAGLKRISDVIKLVENKITAN